MGPARVLLLVGVAALAAVAYNQHAKSRQQEEDLDLLDQYVLHVDRGRAGPEGDDDTVPERFAAPYRTRREEGTRVEKRDPSGQPEKAQSGGQFVKGTKYQEDIYTSRTASGLRRGRVGVADEPQRIHPHLRRTRRHDQDRTDAVGEQLTNGLSGVISEEGGGQHQEGGNDVDGGQLKGRRHTDDASWTHSAMLDRDGRFKLSWTPREDSVEFLVEAATTGYVGLGFSPGGGMIGADMVVGWVEDGTGEAHLVDCHGSDANAAPLVDVDQSYELLRATQNATHTVLRIRRQLDTCDADHDMVLGTDTVRVIWALHPTDPAADLQGLSYHGKEARGTRSLHLVSPPPNNRPEDARVQHWDITLNDFIIPDNMDTLYWCKIFKVPPLKRKHHMIGYEPLLEGGHEGFVHHMLLYECAAPAHMEKQFEKYVTEKGAACYSPSMPQDWDKCLTPVVAWAVGSQGEFLPEHVGLPLAENSRAVYFMLEIHYDNPTFRTARDNSGLRLHYTDDLRRYDGAILVSGITVTPLHIIPPLQPEYRTAGYCSAQCTNRMLPQSGIKLVSVLLHSHLAGKQLRVRHIRQGQELARIAEDDHYDFNYQQSRTLTREVTVLPGDELVTECVYQTPNRSEPTFGGYSTKQEMCLAFILYYPRTPLAACYSMTPVKYFFDTFGVKEFYEVDMDTVEKMFLKLEQPESLAGRLSSTTSTTTAPSFPDLGLDKAMDPEANQLAISVLKKMRPFTEDGDGGGGNGGDGLFGELVIREPPEFQNKSIRSHLLELPWAEHLLTQRVEETLYAGQHMVFCRMPDDQLAIPAEVFNFPNFTELSLPAENSSQCFGKLKESLHSGASVSTSLLSTLCLVLYTVLIRLWHVAE